MKIKKCRAWDPINGQMITDFAIHSSGAILTSQEHEKSRKSLVIMYEAGVKDGKGKELFVDDVIKYRNRYIQVDDVYLHEQIGLFGSERDMYNDGIDIDQTELVGNIYENPEYKELAE